MGIKGLWSVLNNSAESISGDPDPVQVVSAVAGKRVAVDLSIWMAQAQESLKAVAGLSPQACILKIVFERASNWLRHGVIPVAVLEGSPPPEKIKAIQKRFYARTGYAVGGSSGGNSWWQNQSKEVGAMLGAMGLPFVQAPGEAEATCGELSRLGLVDGVATRDGDALLFGSQVVYKELSLSILQPKSSVVTSCTIQDVRNRLGCRKGGADALMAVAALSGGDYDESGLKGVGIEKASMLVSLLLETVEDDSGIIDALRAKLREKPRDDLSTLSAKGCTGCKLCGHDCMSSAKRCTKSRGCRECGTHPLAEGGNGRGGCIVRSLRHAACQCRFHTLALERQADKVVRLAAGCQGLLENMEKAVKAYQRERKLAAAAVGRLRPVHSGAKFNWDRRPDPQALLETLGRICMWDLGIIRRKVLPLLLEWDIANGRTAEFKIKSIVKVNGTNATEQSAGSWRYLLEVKCQTRADLERYVWPGSQPSAEGAEDAENSRNSEDTHQPQVPVWEFDAACFAHSLPARTVRMSLVQQRLPSIVQEFRERVARKEAAKGNKGSGRRTRKEAEQEAAASSRPITSFFAVRKGNKAHAGPEKGGEPFTDWPRHLSEQAAKKKAKTPPRSPETTATAGATAVGYRRGHSSRGPAGRTPEQRKGLAVSLFDSSDLTDSDEDHPDPKGVAVGADGPSPGSDKSGDDSDDFGPLRVRAPPHKKGTLPGLMCKGGWKGLEQPRTHNPPPHSEEVVDLLTPPPPQPPVSAADYEDDYVIVLS